MKLAKLFQSLLAICLVASIGFGPASAQKQPGPSSPSARKQTDNIDRRIDALLARMTLAEKLGQLQQLDGHADGRFKDEHPDLVR
ncbi:MAG: hypothetical protein ACREBC_23475, partial [Pyrinomonadaceae bacterium]